MDLLQSPSGLRGLEKVEFSKTRVCKCWSVGVRSEKRGKKRLRQSQFQGTVLNLLGSVLLEVQQPLSQVTVNIIVMT